MTTNKNPRTATMLQPCHDSGGERRASNLLACSVRMEELRALQAHLANVIQDAGASAGCSPESFVEIFAPLQSSEFWDYSTQNICGKIALFRTHSTLKNCQSTNYSDRGAKISTKLSGEHLELAIFHQIYSIIAHRRLIQS